MTSIENERLAVVETDVIYIKHTLRELVVDVRAILDAQQEERGRNLHRANMVTTTGTWVRWLPTALLASISVFNLILLITAVHDVV